MQPRVSLDGMVCVTGLRERKKVATRRRIAEAALRLAVEHGVDAVTVDDIAAAADISPRTLFNYFTSKDEAVVWAALDIAERVLEVFDAAPAHEPVTASLRSAVVTALRELTAAGPQAALAMGTVHRSAVLQPHWFAAMAEVQNRLTVSIAVRCGCDPERDLYPRLLASVSAAVLSSAFDIWFIDDAVGDLPALAEQSLDLVLAGFPEPVRAL